MRGTSKKRAASLVALFHSLYGLIQDSPWLQSFPLQEGLRGWMDPAADGDSLLVRRICRVSWFAFFFVHGVKRAPLPPLLIGTPGKGKVFP